MTPAVRFKRVARHFGPIKAVDGVDLDIAAGEFFAMLGPSGSGKTTCLRLIAGFEQPTFGSIEIFGEHVEGVPPYRRAVNTVFQDYALFPHMNVADNVAYGLMIRGMDKRGRRGRAEEMLELVKLGGYGDRKPSQLSGGQRQRVALARALVNEPKVLLLDEPLGALDLKLREQMQGELKSLQTRLGITFIFVTHDQTEALAMADRVAVFNEGRIVQVAVPEEIYERPRTRFVADFVGGANVVEPDAAARLGLPRGLYSVRAEKIRIGPPQIAPPQVDGPSRAEDHAVVRGRTVEVQYQGAVHRVVILVGEDRLSVAVPASERCPVEGEDVALTIPSEALNRMDS